MSYEAWVFCRQKPNLPEMGEIGDGQFPFDVRTATNAERQALKQRWNLDDLPWLVIFHVAGDWFDAFDAGGHALARRCGGGVLWFPPSGVLIEDGDNRDFIVAARPDPGDWTLQEALEQAFWLQSDYDQAEWREEVGED